jgi:hypothetical protein
MSEKLDPLFTAVKLAEQAASKKEGLEKWFASDECCTVIHPDVLKAASFGIQYLAEEHVASFLMLGVGAFQPKRGIYCGISFRSLFARTQTNDLSERPFATVGWRHIHPDSDDGKKPIVAVESEVLIKTISDYMEEFPLSIPTWSLTLAPSAVGKKLLQLGYVPVHIERFKHVLKDVPAPEICLIVLYRKDDGMISLTYRLEALLLDLSSNLIHDMKKGNLG